MDEEKKNSKVVELAPASPAVAGGYEIDLTPREIVAELDKYVIGQKNAKKVVAIALRNRTRRGRVEEKLREEIIPKNILMIGPTGVGKTEIARRLSTLMGAPFIKVEATKYTEVGYVGRDVESMVRYLMEAGIRMVKGRRQEKLEPKATELVIDQIVDILQPPSKFAKRKPFTLQSTEDEPPVDKEKPQLERMRDRLREKVASGEMDDHTVEIEVSDANPKMVEIFSNTGIEEMGINIQDMMGNLMPKSSKKRKVTIGEAKKLLLNQEVEKLIDEDAVRAEAVKLVEQSGIIFIDEIDKIAIRKGRGSGPDVSREGVQRDILPIVEGCTVVTKYGPVKTNHILFMAAGAFSGSSPSDLIPELQGRFPLRVELDSLSTEDFRRILTEPRNALIKQYVALLGADGVELDFNEEAIGEIAATATRVNQQTENIGARRLHTLLEKLLEEISFEAPEGVQGEVKIDSGYVVGKLKDIAEDIDLSRYIL